MTVGSYKRVLVTGGAGFIGSNYVHFARRYHPDWKIVVLDKLTYAGNPDNLSEVWNDITFIHGDIADPEAVHRAMAGVDAVINFAAESHVDRSLMDPTPFVRTNVEGTLRLLEEARRIGVSRFLHVSTDEVYGDLAGTDWHSVETDTLAPRSPYSAAKAAAEHMVFAYGVSFGLDVVVTRGSNTYGPRQYPEKIIPLFIANAMEGKGLPVYGDGSAVRDYMHVDDHCSGIDTVLHAGQTGEAYNLGAKLEVSGLTVAGSILALLGRPETLIHHVSDRPGHDYRYAVNPSKAEGLGWKPEWAFEEGLKATVDWYLGHADWLQRVRNRQGYKEYIAALYQKERHL